MTFFEKILKLLLVGAILSMLGLLFAGPYVQPVPYYIALSICFAMLLGWCLYYMELGERNNG